MDATTDASVITSDTDTTVIASDIDTTVTTDATECLYCLPSTDIAISI